MELLEDLRMAGVADQDRDPRGSSRRDEPAIVAGLHGHDGDTAARDPQCDPIADRAEAGDDDVVVDATRDRPATQGLQQPRADERVGDERVDDGNDGRTDQAQEDGIDAQRAIRGDRVDVGRERRPGQERDDIRDRVERGEPGNDLEEDGRDDCQHDQGDPEPNEAFLGRDERRAERGAKIPPSSARTWPRGRAWRRWGHHRRVAVRIDRPADVDEDQVRVADGRIGERADASVGVEPGDDDRVR